MSVDNLRIFVVDSGHVSKPLMAGNIPEQRKLYSY